MCNSNASSSKNWNRILNETQPKSNGVWHEPDKDNFLITLNSSHNFLMKTAVSVTVDFNPRLPPELAINGNERSLLCLESKESSEKLLECAQNMKMSEICQQGSFSPRRERSQNSLRVPQWDLLKSPKANIYSQSSPSQKRVLSPRNMVSPSKRRKSSPPQKNKILRYLIQTNEMKTEVSGGEENIFVDAPWNITDNVKWGNTLIKSPVEKSLKSHDSLVKYQSQKVPEVIVLSSDEEEDTQIPLVQERDQTKTCKKIYSEAVVLSDTESVTTESISNNIRNNIFIESVHANMITDNVSNNVSDNVSGYIVLSDEDEPCLPKDYGIVDITCDECDLEDAGGVIVPDSKECKKSSVDENDYDDDCISEISYKLGASRSEGRRENSDDEADFCEIVEDFTLSGCLGRDETRSCAISSGIDIPLRNRIAPDLKEEQDSFSHLHSLSHEKYETVENLGLNMKILNSKDKKTSSDLQDDNTSDSSLPSPPHIFEDSFQRSDIGNESCGPHMLSRISASGDKNSAKGNSKFTELKKKQNAFCEGNEVGWSDCKSPSQAPIPECNFLPNDLNDDDDDSDDLNDETESQVDDLRIQIQSAEETSYEEIDRHSVPKTPDPDAVRVCQVQAEVLLTKLYQPWVDLGSEYVSQCCIMGSAGCYSLHGKKEEIPEEGEYYDENLVFRMDSGTSAVDLLQSRLDFAEYPTSTVVQYVLLSCMDLWVEGIGDALYWLQELLEEHPPCAFGMLEYYRKIFFNPVPNMGAPDGIFWCCILKIEETMNEMEKPSIGRKSTPNEDSEPYAFLKQFLEGSSSVTSEKEVPEEQLSDRLKKLFNILDFIISVMEADLNTGMMRNIYNLKRYTCKTGRPLIAVALWGIHGSVGIINAKSRQFMKMYFRVFVFYHETRYPQSLRRLISLIAGVTYASERNTEPPKYPNLEYNCMELASTFTSVMMNTELNMAQVPVILSSLRPDWFRICVCSNLLEKLYGRNVEISLQPSVTLLENLSALNLDFPSEEELSRTLLTDPDSNNVSNKELELSSSFVKNAMKKDTKGETRLHIACRRNNVSEVEKLLSVPGITVNEKDNMEWTPLHEAACHGSVECVRKLLDFRTPSGGPAVDLRSKNKLGVTPLMDAVMRNHVQVAFELLQCGGQELLSDRNDDGRSAWDFAQTKEMKNILLHAPDCSKRNDLLTIPRTLYIKLAVLTPLAIVFYIKFSEVTKIVQYLKDNTELTKDGASFFKFHPITFRQDYLQLTRLKSLLSRGLNNQNKLLETLSYLA